MPNRTKLLLAGLIAALAFGALVSAASANRIGLLSQQWRATWNALRFVGFLTIECHVTIEGSFHSRTLSKVLEQLIGYVTKAIVDETHCINGSARVLTETLPWHIRYAGFTGTLPKIQTITLGLIGAAFRVQALEPVFFREIPCLFTSTTTSPARGVVNINTPDGAAESLVPERAPIPLTSGEAACGRSAELSGRSTALTQQASSSKITLTLVE